VKAAETIWLVRPAPVEPAVVLDYRVLHQDDSLLVIDKPAGLPVHPSARYHRNTLTALMRERLGPGHGWEMAHRLDRETSGVMVFGRRRSSARHVGSGGILKRAFAHREVEKIYLALVRGTMTDPLELTMPLGPAAGSRIRIKMGTVPLADGGLPAHTSVRPIAHGEFKGDTITLVSCRPRSGRQHQIRVHLAQAGFAVLGDKLYGGDERAFVDVVEGRRTMADLERELGLHRHALHALRLTFEHPDTQRRVYFEAPWPAELAAILKVPAGSV
jgi:23S rRNA pseudouridine1911/1915/1917 synthase